MDKKDFLVRGMTADGFVKITAVQSTQLVERARQIHKTLPLATAALGRTLTAASMMGNELKYDKGSVTLQLRGRHYHCQRQQRQRARLFAESCCRAAPSG